MSNSEKRKCIWLSLSWSYPGHPLRLTMIILRCHIFSISISRFLDLIILLYFLTDVFLLVGTAISISLFFLLYSLTIIYGLWLFIFLSVWIAKFQRMVSPFVFLITSGWYLYHFSQSNFYYNRKYFNPCKFFTPKLAGGFSLESLRQRFSSALQDSPQYSVQCQQYCHLDGQNSLSDFQFLQPFFPNAPVTIHITVTLTFHIFYVLLPGTNICLSFRFPSF